jgi:hypothetical protein
MRVASRVSSMMNFNGTNRRFALSRDGRSLVSSRAVRVSSEVWLLDRATPEPGPRRGGRPRYLSRPLSCGTTQAAVPVIALPARSCAVTVR